MPIGILPYIMIMPRNTFCYGALSLYMGISFTASYFFRNSFLNAGGYVVSNSINSLVTG